MKYGWILRNWNIEQLVYGGQQEHVGMCIDKDEGTSSYIYNSALYREVEFFCFGDKKILFLPILEKDDVEKEGWNNCTMDFLETISKWAVERILHEKNFVLWRDIIRQYDIMVLEQPNPIPNKYVFVKKDNVRHSNRNLNKTELQTMKEFCAKKEFLDGIMKFRPLSVKGKSIDKPYEQIWLETQNEYAYGSYSSGLRKVMFGGTRYFNKIKPGETLQPWQWKVDKYEGWITSVIAPRRGGKTWYAAYRMIKEMTRDRQDTTKPISVLYVGINKKKNRTMVKYLNAIAENFMKAGYFQRSSADQTMSYVEKGKTRKDDKLLGYIELIGARDEDAGVGGSYDYIVFDEVERLPINVIEDILPIITNEGAKALFISTLNKSSKRTLFYDQIVKGEKEELKRELSGDSVESVANRVWNEEVAPHINDNIEFEEWVANLDIDAIRKKMMMERMWVSLRFTGEDVDVWTEDERDIARDTLKVKPHIFFPEWLGIFADTQKVFDGDSVKKDESYFHNRRYKYMIVGYDPAEKRDKAPLLLGGWNDIDKTIEIIDEETLPKNFTSHAPLIKSYVKEGSRWINENDPLKKDKLVFFVYDYNGVGHGLEPYLLSQGIRIDLKVRFTAGRSDINKKGNMHTIGKQALAEIAKNLFENGSLLISTKCEQLLWELENFVEKETKSGYVKLEGEGASDDHVSAMLMIVYFCLEYMQEKHKIDKAIYQGNKQSDDEKYGLSDDEWNKLYLPYIRQGYSIEQIKRQFGVTVASTNMRRKDLLSKYGY